MVYDALLEQLLFFMGIIALFVIIIVFLRDLLKPKCNYEYYRQQIRELKEHMARERNYYKQLLKDTAVKNDMMRGLWSAYRSGDLSKCYEEQGKPRVLSDGTVICEAGEKSYAIPREEEEYIEEESIEEEEGEEEEDG